ncbi:MAG: dehydrogenase [Sphingobium sp. 66-54]|nr:MAG: dehydrogenase [Sphingobium sp. 66-54]
MNARILGFACTLSLTLLACSGASTPGEAQTGDATRPFEIAAVGTFDAPWAMAFLPGGKMLVTQKQGAMILFDPASGTKQTVAGTPAVVSAGQGALMDVVPAPDFATSNTIYFSYAEAGEGKTNGVALATATLDQAAPALRNMKVIFRATPYIESGAHWSGRIAFSPDNEYLFFTNGERAKADPAQDPKSTLGKVLRLNLDGTPAAGNPLAAKGFHPAIWSYGHRNLLGLAFDKDGRLWEVEMGPLGGDEINLVKPGVNYGWPRASNGSNYDKSDIPDHQPGDGYEPPKVFWNPSLAPAALAYYNAELFPAWRNSLFIPGLSGMALERVALDGENASKADRWEMGARIRSVRVGPDGALWLLEDGPNARMLRLTPKG